MFIFFTKRYLFTKIKSIFLSLLLLQDINLWNSFKNLFKKLYKILTLKIDTFVEKHLKFIIKAFNSTKYSVRVAKSYSHWQELNKNNFVTVVQWNFRTLWKITTN